MLKTNKNSIEKHFSHFLFACGLLALCTQAFASNKPESEIVESEITDSVFSWGTWEYKIAPAAGDAYKRHTSPLNPRSAKVTLRTNSNAALDPTGTAELTPNMRPPIQPAAAPTTPIIITQAPVPPTPPQAAPIVVPTVPATPATTSATPIAPPPAPNIGASPGAPPISGTPLNLGF